MRLTSKTAVSLAVGFAGMLVFGELSANSSSNRISALKSAETGSTTTLTISGTSTPTFTVYKLNNPARVVIELANSRLAETLASGSAGKASWSINSWSVGQVVATQRRNRWNVDSDLIENMKGMRGTLGLDLAAEKVIRSLDAKI